MWGETLKISTKLAAVAASGGAIVLMTPSVSHADTWMLVVNNYSGRCLEIADGSSANGAPAQQWSCNGQSAAKWRVSWIDSERNYFKLVNKASGKCLEIENSSRADYAYAQQWTCKANVKGQIWGWGTNGRLVNAGSARDLTVKSNSKANGARVWQDGTWGSVGYASRWNRLPGGN